MVKTIFIKKMLIHIPSLGFKPSETAIPSELLKENNFEIVFALPSKNPQKLIW